MGGKIKSLEELNKAYATQPKQTSQLVKATESNIKSKIKSKTANKVISKTQRKSQVRASKGVVAAVGILVIIGICLFVNSRGSVRNQIRNSQKVVPAILTPEEQEKWENMEVQKGKFYIELNTRIEVDNRNAYIRLINPIYSAYTFSIQMWKKGDKNNLLYVSEKLMPGTILETIRLLRPLTSDECEVVVNYVIYDEIGEEKNSYPIDVKLIRKGIEAN